MIKLTDAVRRYNGEGDVVAWVERFELIVKLQTKPDEAPCDQAMVLPLFLEGAAYEVYAQMTAELRKDATALKKGLLAAFGMSPSLAYAKLKVRELFVGEAPDSFLAELRRLARVIEGGDGRPLESVVLCQFVDGLPEPTRGQLLALKSGNNWSIDEALACAKGLLQQHEIGLVGGFVGRRVREDQNRHGSSNGQMIGAVGAQRVEEVSGSRKIEQSVKCTGCMRWGHRREACLVKCFGCGGLGHINRNCSSQMRVQGNSGKGAAFERVVPQ